MRPIRSSVLPSVILMALLVPGGAAAAPVQPRIQLVAPRAYSGMAYDASTGTVVRFGGDTHDAQGNATFYADTWIWDGEGWTEQHPDSSPTPRCCMGMAYDRARQRIVMFGGYDGVNLLNDTWTWDGTTWTQEHPDTSPSARELPGMAYDPNRKVVLLFGGGCCDLPDTWTWDGTNWTQRGPAHDPMGRDDGGMVYDGASGYVTVFGGLVECFEDECPTNSMWMWTGNDWRKPPPGTRPSPRSTFGMAYDEIANQTVLFGGCCGVHGALDQTWVWDGVGWTRFAPDDVPPARQALMMAYDEQAQQVVMFGGRVDSYGTDFGDTWTWDGVDWTQR